MNFPKSEKTGSDSLVSQDRVIAFLTDPSSYDPPAEEVSLHETHGALVFLAGDFAYKIKKAVKFPYMDFSTLEKRRTICEHELEINRRQAPEIYLDVVAVTQEDGSVLALNGRGIPAEYAIRMRRFSQDRIFDRLPASQLSDPSLIHQLAKTIYDYHRAASQYVTSDGIDRVTNLIDELMESFHRAEAILSPEKVARFEALARQRLQDAGDCLKVRGETGYIRRCHGDLHLRNIVLLEEKPVLFDALEFDEELATTDTLYDLAFLLMDLDQRGLSGIANTVLNRYLFHSSGSSDLQGLIAMPLFLAIRAGIRAMVALDRAGQLSGGKSRKEIQNAENYFQAALAYLVPRKARLVAVGGFSGTGKTTLAATLAGMLHPHAPGLVHLRSDLERKVMFNTAETERLGQDGYSLAANKLVYEELRDKARICLESNQSAIVDAVFSKDWERALFEELASEFGVPFDGLWLTAEEKVITARVKSRKGDASDATPEVVHKQVAAGAGEIGWQEINSGGTRNQTVEKAMSYLNRPDFDTNQCNND